MINISRRLCLCLAMGLWLRPGMSQSLPMKAERYLSFTTEEGSYMNIDVSADGKFLVFDLLGDLYSLPVSGGKATQLTSGLGISRRPAVSPDGKHIAFLSDNTGSFKAQVIDLNGRRIAWFGSGRIDHDQTLVWFPGGKSFALERVSFNLSGVDKIGKELEYKPLGTAEGKIYSFSEGRLFYRSTIGGKAKGLEKLPSGWGNKLSPNGRWWTYYADSTGYGRVLVTYDRKRGTQRILTPDLVEEIKYYQPALQLGLFGYSPDSRYVFVSHGGKIHRIELASGSDVLVPMHATVKIGASALNRNRFRVQDSTVKVRYIRTSSFSADRSFIVFSALNRIYRMDLHKGSPQVVVRQDLGQYQPAISPDNKWIAFVSWSDTLGGFLWKVPAAGGEPIRLSGTTGQYQRPAWSPDGKSIAVIKGPPALGQREDKGIGQLQIFASSGGLKSTVADSIPLWNQLSFSPDGLRLFYTPKESYQEYSKISSQLVSNSLDGRDLRVHAKGASASHYLQKAISPDQRYLVYSANEELYLLELGKPDHRLLSDSVKFARGLKFARGMDPAWSVDGKMLTWNYANIVYSAPVESIIKAGAGRSTRAARSLFPRINSLDSVVVKIGVSKADEASGLAILGANLITMNGDQVIKGATVLIRNGRITAFGRKEDVEIPSAYQLLDMTGKTIIPGLVDVHLHMRIPPNVFPQQSWMFLVNLAYGVTTARDPSLSYDSFGYAELLGTGQMLGPRLISVGKPARFNDGLFELNSLDEAREFVNKRKLLGATEIKQYTLPERRQRQWLAMACREAGLNMTNEGASDPIIQLGMIKDGSTGIEHNPIWGTIYRDIYQLYAISGTYLTPTLQVCNGLQYAKEYFKYFYWRQPNPKLERFTYSDPNQIDPPPNGAASIETIFNAKPADTIKPEFLTAARIDTKLWAAGAKLPMGSHGNDEGIGAHNEMWALVLGGLSAHDALKSATIVSAEALGIDQDLGSITSGKIADLIILDADPLTDIHNTRKIRYVMKAGTLFDGDTLETLWPVPKAAPAWKANTVKN